jgi:CRISPR/Cas system CSM-associated protein Csm3 (group 7 of RAMP superfamily)
MIKAPYNFVPLNKHIFYPEWSDKVSHDIPFSDGESGEIEIEITAESPIFIKNHYEEGDEYYINKDGKKISKEFCHFKTKDGGKQFFIPATSLKGMIRNVLEIMSFAKIKIDKNTHSKYLSVRDMTNRKELVGTANGCGFLQIKEDGSGIIKDCGKINKISHKKLKEKFNINFKKLKTAKDKYEKIGSIDIPFNNGKLVFTGDINNKKNEFIFTENDRNIKLSKEIVDKFKRVYFKDKNSIDGQFWYEKYKNNKNIEIPVFYQKNNDDKITAIGLTQLFKLSYNKTILEAAKQNEENRLDLAETIFGTIEKKPLKGRVYFSHFISTTTRYEPEKSEILASPKVTYYPNYIKQTLNFKNKEKGYKYKTLMDKDATISGYKRYPIQPKILQSSNTNRNKDIRTKFKPLPKGTKFKGKIVFHNLKKEEIGALLSALTFHNQDKYYHNLGMAKPLGYGKISLKLNLKNLKHEKKEYIKAFEELMDKWYKKTNNSSKWIESTQIIELFAMADKNNTLSLEYQKLERENEFVKSKRDKEYLLPYSKLN